MPLPRVMLRNGVNMLMEGVTTGFTYTLLDKTYQGLHTPFQCKDYLQDLFWSEYMSKSADIYGFKWVSGGIKLQSPFFMLAIANKASLLPRLKNMQLFINTFDNAMGFTKTRIRPTTMDTCLLTIFDGRWTRRPLLLSTFTTIIRLSHTYCQDMDVSSFLDALVKLGNMYQTDYNTTNFHSDLWSNANLPDIGRIQTIRPRLGRILMGHVPTMEYSDISTIGKAHSSGIAGSDNKYWA